MTMQKGFTINSAQNIFTVQDTLNDSTWGPFATEADARQQVNKLEHLAEVQQILGKVIRLEESIWDEITLETDASRQAKQLEADVQKLVDAHMETLKQEQAARK